MDIEPAFLKLRKKRLHKEINSSFFIWIRVAHFKYFHKALFIAKVFLKYLTIFTRSK